MTFLILLHFVLIFGEPKEHQNITEDFNNFEILCDEVSAKERRKINLPSNPETVPDGAIDARSLSGHQLSVLLLRQRLIRFDIDSAIFSD